MDTSHPTKELPAFEFGTYPEFQSSGLSIREWIVLRQKALGLPVDETLLATAEADHAVTELINAA